ncbi:MAG TPA: hypothetical protein VJP80_00530 [Candidatus Saccharimonadales bacterium]|nr:hypothetical protein [Candidatus Saccharimonadales bacterium]
MQEWHKYWRGSGLAFVLSVAALVCLGIFRVDGHVGFSLWDEGYLWYGVQRTLLGEIPLRDFMSYDPGRYYWAAGWLWVFHDHGVVAVRAVTAVFSALGICAAVAFIWKGLGDTERYRIFLCLLTILICALWAVPWWKQYDEATSIFLTISLARVLALPSARRFFVHGIVVGLAAVIGRNHGFYGVVACLLATPLLMLTAHRLNWLRCILAWAGGVILGFGPIIVGLLVDQRFAAMFWGSIHFMLFEYKGTNLPLPVPWPWKVVGGQSLTPVLIRSWCIGCLYVAMPLLCLGGLCLLVRSLWHERRFLHPAFAACALTAIPYLNVAYSRADDLHLAQSIFPLTLGLLLYPWHQKKAIVARSVMAFTLAAIALWVALPLHPAYLKRSQSGWRRVAVNGDKLWMDAGTAASVEDVKQLANHYLSQGGTILSVPVWPGTYALLGIKSPVYEIYPLFPRSDAFQRQEIVRLEHASPSLVLFNDIAVDGRNDLRYGQTHAHILDYIDSHYHQIASPAGEPQLKVYMPNPLRGDPPTQPAQQ